MEFEKFKKNIVDFIDNYKTDKKDEEELLKVINEVKCVSTNENEELLKNVIFIIMSLINKMMDEDDKKGIASLEGIISCISGTLKKFLLLSHLEEIFKDSESDYRETE